MKAPIVENSSSDSFSMTRDGVDSATISFFPEPEQRPGDDTHQSTFLNGFGTEGTLNSMTLTTPSPSGETDMILIMSGSSRTGSRLCSSRSKRRARFLVIMVALYQSLSNKAASA